MTDTDSKRLDKLEEWFKEMSIRFDQSMKDGKTVMSISSTKLIVDSIIELVKVVKRINRNV